jgi:hypothetical protein
MRFASAGFVLEDETTTGHASVVHRGPRRERGFNMSMCQNKEARLFEAAASGDCARVEEALRHGAAVDARDTHHRTPLMLAADLGHAHAVCLLLANGANPNPSITFGSVPPLISAYLADSKESMAHLLDAGADSVDGMRSYRSTLVIAIEDGRHDVIRLIAPHLPSDSRAHTLTSVMRWAIDNHDWATIELLHELGGDPAAPSVLEAACRRSRRAVEFVIEKGARPGRHVRSERVDHAGHGELAIADLLGERASWLTRYGLESMTGSEICMAMTFDFGRLLYTEGWTIFLINQGHEMARTLDALVAIRADDVAAIVRSMLSHCRELMADEFGFGGGWIESDDADDRRHLADLERKLVETTSRDTFRRLMFEYAWDHVADFRTWVETWSSVPGTGRDPAAA